MTKDEANKLIVKICNEMYDAIAWYVWNHCHDEEMTKDILQEIFLEVCRHVDDLSEHENYQGWVYKAAQFKLKKIGKEKTRRNQKQVQWNDVKEENLAINDEYDFLIFDEYSHVLNKEKLDLLKAHYYTGKTVEDIAHEKGKTVGEIKMQMKRARDELKKYLQGKGRKDI